MDITQTAVVRISGRVLPGDVPRLCEELRARIVSSGAAEAVCEVGGLTRADLAAVEALARLRLTARRLGCRMRLGDAGPELLALLELTGLGVLAEPGPR